MKSRGWTAPTFLCHVQRIKFYDTTTSVMDQGEVMWQFIHDGSRFEVAALKEARWNADLSSYEVLLEGKGLEKPTWDPTESLA